VRNEDVLPRVKEDRKTIHTIKEEGRQIGFLTP
jgi:hypothetical protein